MGSLAHLALERWIRTSPWQDTAGPERPGPAELFEAAAEEAGVRVDELLDGRLTKARLGRRAAEFEGLIASFSTAAVPACEVALTDQPRRLHGRADLVVSAPPQLAVIDLKTGLDGASRQLPDHIITQLQFYYHLATVTYGRPPTYLAVFSLQAGLRPVTAGGQATAALIERISRARDDWVSGDRTARPNAVVCRYCPRRLECEPHWAAASSWEDNDGVEGQVLRVAVAETGALALYLNTGTGRGWLTQLPPGRVDSRVAPGQVIRAIHVRDTPTAGRGGAGPPGSREYQWQAAAATVVSLRR